MIRGVSNQGVGGARLLCVYRVIPAPPAVAAASPAPAAMARVIRGRKGAGGTWRRGWALRPPKACANPGPGPQQDSGDCPGGGTECAVESITRCDSHSAAKQSGAVSCPRYCDSSPGPGSQTTKICLHSMFWSSAMRSFRNSSQIR